MSDPKTARFLIEDSLNRVERWVERHEYQGYEPFDGLSSWFRPLTFGNLFAERLLLQLIRQSPVNLRPLMGVTAKDSTKGRGYMAAGYLVRYRTTGNPDYLRKAESCLDWLDHHKAQKAANHSWSNHFDFASRGGSYTKDDPIIVWTALIGFAYLDAYELTGAGRWLEIADSACGWIMNLPREKSRQGDCNSYQDHEQCSIRGWQVWGGCVMGRTSENTDNRRTTRSHRDVGEYN